MDGNKNLFKVLFWIGLIFNVCSILLHLVSLLILDILQEITALLMIFTISYDILFIIINFNIIERKSQAGRLIKNLLWIYLVFLFFATFFVMINPILSALGGGGRGTQILFFIGYYGIFSFGLCIFILDIKNLNNLKTWV